VEANGDEEDEKAEKKKRKYCADISKYSKAFEPEPPGTNTAKSATIPRASGWIK
jgi:hypothetical protein